MSPPLDSNLCQELAEVIESLTHSGQKTLDPELLKKVKKICKSDEALIERAFHLLLHPLQEKHSEVRFSAFQLIDELFSRSHRFRVLCCGQLRTLLSLCTGLAAGAEEASTQLPPPAATASALRRSALATFARWHASFGTGYAELRHAHSYLTRCKKIDLEALEVEGAGQRAAAEAEAKRRQAVAAQRLRNALVEFSELEEEIQNTVTSLENCIELLVPSLDNFFISLDESEDDKLGLENSSCPIVEEKKHANEYKENEVKGVIEKDEEEEEGAEEEEEEEEFEPNYIREHGMMNTNFSVDVQVKPSGGVQETEENAAVCDNARDLLRLIQRKLLPSVRHCMRTITKCSGSAEDVRKVLVAKESLERVEEKSAKLGLDLDRRLGIDDEASSGEDDLEEVPEKEGYEEEPAPAPPVPASTSSSASTAVCSTPAVTKAEWGLFTDKGHSEDPTSLLSTLSSLETKGKKRSAKNISSEGASSVKRVPSADGSQSSKWISTSDEPSSSKGTPAAERPSTSKETSLGDGPSTSKGTRSVAGSSAVMSSLEVASCSKDSVDGLKDSGKAGKGESRKQRLLAVAPRLPFDVDLYHWEDENLTAPTILTVKSDAARFWSATPLDELEEVHASEGAAVLRTRVIEFTGEGASEGRDWACRAPLPSGALCPRRDKIKCPFHGRIVARDEVGRCQNPEDAQREREEAERRQQECPDWQDPALLKEIKEATGIDLKMPEKGKRKKRKKDEPKYPGLTDIKAKQNNAYTRLAKKVFKKTTMKRVAKALDKADHRKFRDKFGDQFNYVHEPS